MNLELEPERLIHASDGHFITEGGGYALRAYIGEVPNRLLAGDARNPLADDGGAGNAVAVTSLLVAPGCAEHK